MNKTARLILGIVVLILGFVGFSSIFTVHQAEQALVLRLGKIVRTVNEPGLKFKIPGFETVLFFDKRVLDFDNQAEEVPTSDQRQLVVDTFARYRIVDPVKFFETVTNEEGMSARLRIVINTALRNVLGSVPQTTILTEERGQLMQTIAELVNTEGEQFGINVVDVRIKRVDLPEQNSQKIYERMQTEREQEARKIRAEGGKEDKRIRAEADKQSRIIIADANRQSEVLRGEGDGKAQETYNNAYSKDPKFFRFYESMRSYKQGLGGDTTRYIGPPDGDFFKFFGEVLVQ